MRDTAREKKFKTYVENDFFGSFNSIYVCVFKFSDYSTLICSS